MLSYEMYLNVVVVAIVCGKMMQLCWKKYVAGKYEGMGCTGRKGLNCTLHDIYFSGYFFFESLEIFYSSL